MPRNMIQQECDDWWYSHQGVIRLVTNGIADGSLLLLKNLLAARFEAGARWSMIETTRLNPYVSQFMEMITLLGILDTDNEHAGLAEETSARTSSGESGDDDSGMSEVRGAIPVFPDSDEAAARNVRQLHTESATDLAQAIFDIDNYADMDD